MPFPPGREPDHGGLDTLLSKPHSPAVDDGCWIVIHTERPPERRPRLRDSLLARLAALA